jgi:hypothetical protein
MMTRELTKTISLKQCTRCNAELLDRDKFCRSCGIQQRVPVHPSTGFIKKPIGCDCESTRPGSSALRRSYSHPLLRIVTRELSLTTTALRSKPWTMHLFSVLVTVPFWLIIVLLSPLDAYVAAKSIAKQF